MRGINRALITALCLGLTGPAALAVDKADIDRMVEKGVKYLKTLQKAEGQWPAEGNQNTKTHEPGATALAALTLLVCDVPANDPVVQKAADFVRTRSPELTYTYSIALSIMFLDYLGDTADIPLIESLMVRLMAGQLSDGGWFYNCPPISPEEVQRLLAQNKKRNELRSSLSAPKDGSKKKPSDLSPEIQRQVGAVLGGGGGQGGVVGGISDNSNTQFALFAMWVGRKHGLPVDAALAKVARKFRTTQKPAGTWGYVSSGGGLIAPIVGGVGAGAGAGVGAGDDASTQMTCAGVLALAVEMGATMDLTGRRIDINQDPVMVKGLAALGSMIGEPVGPGGKVMRLGPGQGKAYYTLWSLERVCIALGLDHLHRKDWHNWGAEILQENQGTDGSWQGEYSHSGADTAWALLFLRRANLARDLSGKFKGRVVLKAGKLPASSGPKALDQQKPVEDKRPKDKTEVKPITSGERTETQKLSDELVKAKGTERERVLKNLRDTKGQKYTEALAQAIPLLSDTEKQEARDALQLRFLRLKADSLGRYLKEADSEMRAAAALACAGKEPQARERVPQIIDLLADSDPYVSLCAHTALKLLTKEDFGPGENADREMIVKAINDWKDWWKKNG